MAFVGYNGSANSGGIPTSTEPSWRLNPAQSAQFVRHLDLGPEVIVDNLDSARVDLERLWTHGSRCSCADCNETFGPITQPTHRCTHEHGFLPMGLD